MPHIYQHIPAEILLEYKGIIVYCTYKNGYFENGAAHYWYSLEEDDEKHEFDVRDLPNYDKAAPYDRAIHADFIREALDHGYLDEQVEEAGLPLPRLVEWPGQNVSYHVKDLDRWQLIRILEDYHEHIHSKKDEPLIELDDFYNTVFLPKLKEETKR